MHPALIAVLVGNLAPDIEFLDDLDRQSILFQHQRDGIAQTGACPQIDLIRIQGYKPRNRQLRSRGFFVGCIHHAGRCQAKRQKQHCKKLVFDHLERISGMKSCFQYLFIFTYY